MYLLRGKLLFCKSDSMSVTYLYNPQFLVATKPFHRCPFPIYIARIALNINYVFSLNVMVEKFYDCTF